MGRQPGAGRDDAKQVAALLEQSRAELMDAMAGLDEAGFRTRPDSATWSVAEALAHLLDTERTLRTDAEAAREQHDYFVTSKTDAERQEAARLAQRMAVPQLVHGLLAERRDTLRLLAGLSREELERPLRHEARGELKVGWLFRHLAEHEADHAAQIRTLRQAAPTGNT